MSAPSPLINEPVAASASPSRPRKLHGREFYESIGSPKLILAPMVDQSEFAWRMLTRSFLPPEYRRNVHCYSPMIHARMFMEKDKYRDQNFQPSKDGFGSTPATVGDKLESGKVYLDGREDVDRPLTVQFCANDPEELLKAAKWVQPYCDAVDLNLGCPQGIARKGKYGAFLQEDWDLICRMLSNLHKELDVPVTAKIRVLETKEQTLEYAKRIIDAGASIITIHGRRREQKGHFTGLADWSVIRYVRDNLPKEVVMFANGNILRHEDIARCLEATGADGVMSAEGNLADPTIFAEPPPVGSEGREYWRGRDGKGGYRMDAVFRRYLDIIHQYVLQKPVPTRKPLFLPSDPPQPEEMVSTKVKSEAVTLKHEAETEDDDRPKKRQKRNNKKEVDDWPRSPNLTGMQAHLFHLLRPLVSKHTHVRDALAKSRAGDITAFERVLALTEEVVKEGLREYEQDPARFEEPAEETNASETTGDPEDIADLESSVAAVKACKRPWWVCQPYVRPLPKEALEKGSVSLSKKDLRKIKAQELTGSLSVSTDAEKDAASSGTGDLHSAREKTNAADGMKRDEIPKEAMVAG